MAKTGKIIGYEYVSYHGSMFAVDIYEGNYYHLPDGNIDSLNDRQYSRVLEQYEKAVEEDVRIITSYEMNQRIDAFGSLDFTIPTSTSNPDAAEMEWFQRKHPKEEFQAPEIEKAAEKKGFFAKRGKKKEGLQKKSRSCPVCGEENPETQKFCGNCGAELTKPQKREEPEETEPKEEDYEDDYEEEEPVRKKKHPQEKERKPREKRFYEEEEEPEPEEKRKPKPKRRRSYRKRMMLPLFYLFCLLIGIGITAGAVFAIRNLGHQQVVYGDVPKAPTSNSEEPPQTSDAFVAIKVTRRIEADNADTIKEEDLEGTILTVQQYEALSGRGTFINENGEEFIQTPIPWEEREKVIGQYVTATLPEGSILYDTSITTQHVVAEKTYVEGEVDGETVTWEYDTDVLPGSTKVQIVALVSTDGKVPVQVILSEMTLENRSLKSIFNSAGQDILEQLTNRDEEPETPEDSNEDTSSEEEAE